MRLLHAGIRAHGASIVEGTSEPERRRYRSLSLGQSLPLCRLSGNHRGGEGRGAALTHKISSRPSSAPKRSTYCQRSVDLPARRHATIRGGAWRRCPETAAEIAAARRAEAARSLKTSNDFRREI